MSEKKGAEGADIKNDIPILIGNCVGNTLAVNYQLTLTRWEAASYLWNLAIQEAKRGPIIDESLNGRCFTQLLAASGPTAPLEAKLCAAGCLHQLMSSPDRGDDIKADVVAAKAVPSLVALLASGTDAMVQVVCDCLRLISTKPDLTLKMAPVVLPALAPHIMETNHDRRHTVALACLHQMTKHGAKAPFMDAVLKPILDLGLLPPITALMTKSRDAVMHASGILFNLSKAAEPAFVAAILEAGALPLLLAQLGAEAPETRLACIGCVRSFLDERGGRRVDPELKAAVGRESLRDITALLAPCDPLSPAGSRTGGLPEAQTHAAACLWLLAVEPAIAGRIVATDAVRLLSAMLSPGAGAPGAKGKKPKGKKGGPLSLEDRTRRFFASGALWCLCDESAAAAKKIGASDPAVPGHLLKVWTPVKKQVFHGQHDLPVVDLYKMHGVPPPVARAGLGSGKPRPPPVQSGSTLADEPPTPEAAAPRGPSSLTRGASHVSALGVAGAIAASPVPAQPTLAETG